jgi:hypothetical protein
MAAGYGMALLTTALGTYLLVGAMNSGRLERWIDSGVPKALLSVQILVGATALWMLAGTGLAALYLAGDFAGMPGALGTPSIAFALIVAALAVAPLPLLFVVNIRRWWMWASMAALFVALFGWILPLAGE